MLEIAGGIIIAVLVLANLELILLLAGYAIYYGIWAAIIGGVVFLVALAPGPMVGVLTIGALIYYDKKWGIVETFKKKKPEEGEESHSREDRDRDPNGPDRTFDPDDPKH